MFYSFVLLKVLSFQETLASYKSVYYVGTIVPILCVLLGYVIKPARPVKPKARKAEWGTEWIDLYIDELRSFNDDYDQIVFS